MLAEAHAASVLELSEISRSLSQYAEQLDLDPEQLASLEERVSLFETLKRKYGGSITEVIAFGEQASERLHKIEGRDEELERLSREIDGVGGSRRPAGLAETGAKTRRTFRKHSLQRAILVSEYEFEAQLSTLDEACSNGLTRSNCFLSEPGRTLKRCAQSLRVVKSHG